MVGKLDLSPNPFSSNVTGNFTCEICIEPNLSDQRFKNKTFCNHPFCKDCIVKYIKVKIENNNVGTIKCPSLCCDFDLDIHSCRLILPTKLFERWCDILSQEAIMGMDFCYCPNQVCSALIINECGGDVDWSFCYNCKQTFCFKCKIPWHAGFDCEDSGEIRDTNDLAFGALADMKRWQRCPKCKFWVSLESGCDTIKCRCGIKFCYNCGAKKVKYKLWCKCLEENSSSNGLLGWILRHHQIFNNIWILILSLVLPIIFFFVVVNLKSRNAILVAVPMLTLITWSIYVFVFLLFYAGARDP